MNNKYDILIVGAGPAGISTWLHLHKYAPELASRTLVIDKAIFPRDKLCGGAVGGWSEKVFKYLNVEIKSPSLFINEIECCFEEDSFSLNKSKFFRVVHRKEFDNELVQIAINQGLIIHFDEQFIDYEKNHNELIVKTNRQSYNIKILIGADGSSSRVRKRANLHSEFHLAPAIELFKPYNNKIENEHDEKKIVIDFNPINKGVDGYIWHFPCIIEDKPYMNHGVCNFCINTSSHSSKMKILLSQELLKRAISDKINYFSGHATRVLSKNDTLSDSHVFLIGDAAGIEKATGGGIHLALSYGDVAAKAIIDAYDRDDFSFNDYEERVHSHLVGKWIFKCNKLGDEMYSGRMNPLDAARQVFSIKE